MINTKPNLSCRCGYFLEKVGAFMLHFPVKCYSVNMRKRRWWFMH